MIALIENLLLALTDPQVDRVIDMIEKLLEAGGKAVSALWTVLSPALMTWVLVNQFKNRALLRENTSISDNAFKEANNHNAKISALMEEIRVLKENQK
jgi:hypothetical protein